MPRLHNEIFTLILDLYSHPLSRSTFLHAVLSLVLLRKDQQRSLKIPLWIRNPKHLCNIFSFHYEKLQHFKLNSVKKTRTMRYWPAKVLVQLGCTLQVGLTEQALCKWMDLNKRQLLRINPRPGVLSEQAGDNPRHLAFERPPREYARGEGEGRSVKAAPNEI